MPTTITKEGTTSTIKESRPPYSGMRILLVAGAFFLSSNIIGPLLAANAWSVGMGISLYIGYLIYEKLANSEKVYIDSLTKKTTRSLPISVPETFDAVIQSISSPRYSYNGDVFAWQTLRVEQPTGQIEAKFTCPVIMPRSDVASFTGFHETAAKLTVSFLANIEPGESGSRLSTEFVISKPKNSATADKISEDAIKDLKRLLNEEIQKREGLLQAA